MQKGNTVIKKGEDAVYSIKITAKAPVNKKQKEILIQSAAEAGAQTVFRKEDTLCEISGSGADLEKLSYLMGIAMGSFSSDDILKLMISFER